MKIREIIDTDEIVYGPVVSTERPPDEVRVSQDPRSAVEHVYAGGRYRGTLEGRDGPHYSSPRYRLTVVPWPVS